MHIYAGCPVLCLILQIIESIVSAAYQLDHLAPQSYRKGNSKLTDAYLLPEFGVSLILSGCEMDDVVVMKKKE